MSGEVLELIVSKVLMLEERVSALSRTSPLERGRGRGGGGAGRYEDEN